MIVREHTIDYRPREVRVDSLGEVFEVPWIKEHGESNVRIYRHYVMTGIRVLAHLFNEDGTPHA
jgi:hypothetical protein